MNNCKPFKCSGFLPNGAKFCHVCGGKYSEKDLKIEAEKPTDGYLF